MKKMIYSKAVRVLVLAVDGIYCQNTSQPLAEAASDIRQLNMLLDVLRYDLIHLRKLWLEHEWSLPT